MFLNSEFREIDKVKERIVYNSLLLGSFLGIISFAISLFGRERVDFKYGILFDSLTLLLFIVTFLFHKKISLKGKSIIIIIGLLIFVYLDTYKHGLFSDNKVLLILIPFFSFLIYNLRTTIILFIVLAISYMAFGVLFNLKILTPVTDYYIRGVAVDVWMLNLILISIIAFIVIIIVKQFFETFNKLIKDLSAQNEELLNYRNKLEILVSERTNDLNAVNEELRTSNEELVDKSRIITKQNIELKLMMEDLKKTQSQLIQTEKMASLGILTAGIAHELNNPLNFILGGYSGLKTICDSNEFQNKEDINSLLESIKIGAERSISIVQGLNKLNRDNEVLDESCDLYSIIDSCLYILNHEIKDRITVEKKYDSKYQFVNGNNGKLHQVFLNIIHNSIQAIENSGIITITISNNSKHIIIDIFDTGCGISNENILKVTDPFFTTKQPGKGTGLGLSIAFTIIKEHNGTIDIQSETNKGTSVKVLLPILFNE